MKPSILHFPYDMMYQLGQTGGSEEAVPVPETVDGLYTWFDAFDLSTITEDVGVSQWGDKSGNGSNATQDTEAKQPATSTIGGRNAIAFTGDQFLNLGQPANMDFVPGTDEFTVFTVAAVNGGNTGTLLAKAETSTSTRQFMSFITSDDYATYVGGTRGTNSVETVVNTPKVFTTTVSTTDVTDFVNGAQTDTRAISGTATNAYDWLIGARRSSDNTGDTFNFTGDIGEILVYGRALSDTERQKIETYLQNKWIYSNTLILLGASIIFDMASFAGVQSIINRQHHIDVTVVNAGVSGETIEEIAARVDSVLATNGEYGGHVFIHAGGNNVTDDRPFSTMSTEELQSFVDSLNYIITAVRNANMIPVVSDLTFRDYDDTTVYLEENGSRPFNENLIKDIYSSRHPEWCFSDGQPYAQLYDLFRNSYTTYLGSDNVHHLSAGRVAAANHISDVIYGTSLLGDVPTRLYSPSGNEMQLWHDYADTSTIAHTAGVVTAVTDKSQRGITITTTSAPTTNTGTMNGLNALVFDGVDNHLNLGQPASLEFTPRTDAFTIHMVTEVTSATSGALISKAGATSGSRQAYLFALGAAVSGVVGGTGETYATDIRGAVKVLTFVVSTTTQKLYVDGVLIDVGAISTATNANDWLIGARRSDDANGGTAFPLTGKIGEVIIYSTEQTDENRIRTNNYLMRKWRNE